MLSPESTKLQKSTAKKSPDYNELLSSDGVFKLIPDSIVDGIVLTDPNGIIRYINAAGKGLLGVTGEVVGVQREELVLNRAHLTKYQLDYQYDPVEAFNLVLRGQKLEGLFLRVLSDPPTLLDVNYVPLYDNGEIMGVMGDFRDVTLVHQQQEQLDQQKRSTTNQEKRWETIFNSVEEGICVLDRSGRIIEFSPTLEIMSGFTSKEAVGKKYHELFKCHDRKGNYLGDSIVHKAYLTGETVPYDEHLHLTKDGVEQWVGTTCAPIFNKRNEMEFLIVIRDISTYKQVEKLKSEFVSIASHELRTPLTVVNGYLSLLTSGDLGNLSDPARKEQHETILKKVFLETKRLNSLVEDLLNISRIEEGRLRIETQPLDIKQLIEDTVNEFKILAETKQLSLDFETHFDKLMVNGDPNKLKQVLTNMLDNAIKYTDEGRVVVYLKENPKEAVIEIKDTGPGIPDKLKNLIFEKFQQAPGSYLKQNKGTGLGLFIVKGIVDLHQGKVWVESVPKRGSTFTFTLPKSREV